MQHFISVSNWDARAVIDTSAMETGNVLFRVDEYCKALEKDDWTKIKVRNTAKGKLKGMYHFRNVFIFVYKCEPDPVH